LFKIIASIGALKKRVFFIQCKIQILIYSAALHNSLLCRKVAKFLITTKM